MEFSHCCNAYFHGSAAALQGKAQGLWVPPVNRTSAVFGAEVTDRFAFRLAGRQPGGFIILAGRCFCSRKTPKDFRRAKTDAGEEEDSRGLTPTQDEDDVRGRFGPTESVSVPVNRG